MSNSTAMKIRKLGYMKRLGIGSTSFIEYNCGWRTLPLMSETCSK